ncbi:hypothetical protein [Streptomyces atriruber]|uniref:hypothetical protein n=1 Tax=Streptomyces atriruber TaxID=545121 RepID=UPI0006E157DD|nr:hypothetical protein [Streptomyces atriruber]
MSAPPGPPRLPGLTGGPPMNGRQKLTLGCVASGSGLLSVLAIGDAVTGGDLTRPAVAPTVTVTVTAPAEATSTRTPGSKPKPKPRPARKATPAPTPTPTRSRPATGGGRPAVGFGRSCAPVGALAATLDGRPAKCFMGRDGRARWGYDANRG